MSLAPNNTRYRASSQDVLGAFVFLLALLVGFFVGYPRVQAYIGLQQSYLEVQDETKKLGDDMIDLKKVQESLKDEVWQKNVERYAGSYSEDEILSNLSKMIHSSSSSTQIKDISLSRGAKDTSGLSRAMINVGVSVASKAELGTLLNGMLSTESPYRRVLLKTFSMPEGDGPYEIALALEMYYFDEITQ